MDVFSAVTASNKDGTTVTGASKTSLDVTARSNDVPAVTEKGQPSINSMTANRGGGEPDRKENNEIDRTLPSVGGDVERETVSQHCDWEQARKGPMSAVSSEGTTEPQPTRQVKYTVDNNKEQPQTARVTQRDSPSPPSTTRSPSPQPR